MSAEDVIRLLEKGAEAKPPPEKQPTAGIIIRVNKPPEREIKTVKSAVRRGLPAAFKPEDPQEE